MQHNDNNSASQRVIDDVEQTLAKTLQATDQREKAATTVCDDSKLNAVFDQLEGFHERLEQLQQKAEQATQTTNAMDRTWKKTEALFRDHLDRADRLSEVLRRFVRES